VDPRLVAAWIGTVVVVVAAAVGTGVAFVWVRKQVVEVLRARRRRALPPQMRMPVTLVSTDIAGSTELWEWDTQQAAEVSWHQQ
jgi:class 3 adenylate cyclase